MSQVALVYAVSQNGVIGKAGGLPWHIPSDLKWFKAVTLGKPVIMGRKTWDSLPRKPLPGRVNIVISRAGGFHAEGAMVVADVESAMKLANLCNPTEICVIGGAEIYRLFMPLAQKIYLTRILADVVGDTFMPELDAKLWHETERQAHLQGEKDSAAFETVVYQRT
jgi:dihydrofolate reductase